MAQMASRNADKGLWRRKLKITVQLKENKRGFIGNNCLKREREKKKNPSTRGKKMRRHKSKPDENYNKQSKEEGRKGTILQKMSQENESSGYPHSFFFFLQFLRLHLWHTEVPRLGVELGLHLRPMPQPQQHRIQTASATYAAACGNTGSLTH